MIRNARELLLENLMVLSDVQDSCTVVSSAVQILLEGNLRKEAESKLSSKITNKTNKE